VAIARGRGEGTRKIIVGVGRQRYYINMEGQQGEKIKIKNM
jgi:hypothetical protein